MKHLFALLSLSVALAACAKDDGKNSSTHAAVQASTETNAALAAVTDAEKNLVPAGCSMKKELVSRDSTTETYEFTMSCANVVNSIDGLEAAKTALENYVAALKTALGKSPDANTRRELEAKLTLANEKLDAVKEAILQRRTLGGEVLEPAHLEISRELAL